VFDCHAAIVAMSGRLCLSSAVGNVPMKILLTFMSVFALTVIAGERGTEDVATTVIRSEFHAAYNPLDNSEAELNKAAAINSALRLQHLMLHEVSDPELRVCYALRVLESQIVIARRSISVSRSDSAQKHLDILLKRQAELAGWFRELQKQKAEQADAHEPPPRASVRTWNEYFGG
jgi:hypothetical protein